MNIQECLENGLLKKEKLKGIGRLLVLFILGLFLIPIVLAETDFSYKPLPNFGGILLIVVLIIMHNMEKRSKEKNGGKPIGVDGWLLLFMLLMFASPIFSLLSYLISIKILFVNASILDVLFTLSDWILFGFGIYIAINLWKINPKAINWSKIWIVISLISEILYYWFISTQPELYEGTFADLSLFQTIIFSIIWLPYLFISKRVKNTFVHRAPKIPIPKSNIVTLIFFIIVANIPFLILYFMADDIAMETPIASTIKEEEIIEEPIRRHQEGMIKSDEVLYFPFEFEDYPYPIKVEFNLSIDNYGTLYFLNSRRDLDILLGKISNTRFAHYEKCKLYGKGNLSGDCIVNNGAVFTVVSEDKPMNYILDLTII